MTPQRRRWIYRIVVAIAVSPILVTAIRFGLAGWEPIEDTGRIAIRVRDVFSARPPLFGLAAWTSVNAPEHYSFPGALLYYLLAVPVRVLGTNWGLLLGMATINTGMCVAALWLIRRRLGERGAILASAFLASLLWTMGGLAMIDPSQHNMGVLPLFALFVAAWSVADGDTPALAVLAVVGNYLVLDLPDVVVVAPVLGLWALVMWARHLRRCRREEPEHWPGLRRRNLRWFAAAGIFTVVVWIPPVIDQVAGTGNLGKLAHAAVSGDVAKDQPAELEPTIPSSFGVVSSITVTPRWWLRPTYAQPPFTADGGGEPALWRAAWALAVAAAIGFAAVRLRRRRDRTLLLGIGTAVVAWVAFFVTVYRDPSDSGFAHVDYLRGLWPLAVFLWFILTWIYVAQERPLVPVFRRLRGMPVVGGAVAAVLFAVAAMPYNVSGTEWQMISVARDLRHATAEEFAGSGPVQVSISDWMLHNYEPSLMLGLQDVGVPFRVDLSYNVQQFGSARDAASHPAVTRIDASSSPWTPPGGRLIARAIPPPLIDDAAFRQADARMGTWAAAVEAIELSEDLEVTRAKRAELTKELDTMLTTARRNGTDIRDSPEFLGLLVQWGRASYGPLIEVPGLSSSQITAWAAEKLRRDYGTVYLYEIPVT